MPTLWKKINKYMMSHDGLLNKTVLLLPTYILHNNNTIFKGADNHYSRSVQQDSLTEPSRILLSPLQPTKTEFRYFWHLRKLFI